MTYLFQWEHGLLPNITKPFSSYINIQQMVSFEGFTGYYRGKLIHIETWPYLGFARMFNGGSIELAKKNVYFNRQGYPFLFSLLPPLWNEFARALMLNAILWFAACICLIMIARQFFTSDSLGFLAAILLATDFAFAAMAGDVSPHLFAVCWFFMGVYLATKSNFSTGKPSWRNVLAFALWAAGGGLGYEIHLMIAAFGIVLSFPRLSIVKIVALILIAITPAMAVSFAVQFLGGENIKIEMIKSMLHKWLSAYQTNPLQGVLWDIKLFIGQITTINPLLLVLALTGFPSIPREMKKVLCSTFIVVFIFSFIFSHYVGPAGCTSAGFIPVLCLASAQGLRTIAHRLSGIITSKSVRRFLYASILLIFISCNIGMTMTVRFTKFPGFLWAFTWGGPPYRPIHIYWDRLPEIEKL
ncbi:MAG: hypothetical protein AB1546_04005 [bacterium]